MSELLLSSLPPNQKLWQSIISSFVPLLARSAVAAGIDGLFMETHTNPQQALSDSSVVFDLTHLGQLLDTLLAIHSIVQQETS